MFVVVGWVGVTKYMCVCMSPLPAAIKGKRGKSFPGEGVHVDTVAVSLFLVCIWSFLVGGGGRVIGWQHFRKRELPHSEKRRQTDHIGYSCCVAPREPQPPMLPGVPHLTWADSELV